MKNINYKSMQPCEYSRAVPKLQLWHLQGSVLLAPARNSGPQEPLILGSPLGTMTAGGGNPAQELLS